MTAPQPRDLRRPPGAGVPGEPDDLRARLCALLQEDDPERTLDSLEQVVVAAWFTKRTSDGEVPALPDAPRTVEGWVTWAARRSSAS
ncbi:hypothetical protein [Streptomyces sp. NPDC059176]|uniref:hypothetical protein n=1 Tax=unclassified Streptomyces TaxID=2593676 RepID=UPI0036C7E01D